MHEDRKIKKKKAFKQKTRRKKKAKVLFADSEKDADILYATKVFMPDPFLFVQLSGEKYVVVSDLEYSRVKKQAKVTRVYSFREVMALNKGNSKKRGGYIDYCQIILLAKRVREIEVPAGFPLGFADELRDRGFIVNSRPNPFFPERAVKGPEEVKAIQYALKATEYGLKVAADILKEAKINRKKKGELILGGQSLTSERMRVLIQKAILDMQCQAKHTIVACGLQSYDPHQRGEGPLRANEPIIVDIFPRSEMSGYHGDMTRTFVKGRAPEAIRAMFQAVKKAQKHAISRAKPGVRADKIHRELIEMFDSEGYPTQEEGGRIGGFFHGTGHGLGLDLHEYPPVGNLSCRLRKGNVVTIEPGLYYPQVGGVRLEDVILIGSQGARRLTRFPHFLEV